jgi:hypothetical protein
VAERFRDLEKRVRINFQAGEAAWHWANEDYDMRLWRLRRDAQRW